MSAPAEVSVIVPTHNHAGYLSVALRSILAQTFAAWEAVVVDDGSTDDTHTAVKLFSDPRIRYVYQANKGLAAARNTGIRLASGQFLAFLDADDAWSPAFLQRCVGTLRSSKSLAGVYTRYRHIDEDGMVLPQVGGRVVHPRQFHQRLSEGGFFPPSVVVVRAAAVREAGLFDPHLRSAEDWDVWLSIARRHPFRGLAEPLADYRVSPGSMSTDLDRMHASRLAVLAKHFGPPIGESSTWSKPKRRAYGFAYQTAAVQYVQLGRYADGWQLLGKAAEIFPGVLLRVDTFYELTCGTQPRGFRGQARLVNVARNGAELRRRLDDLFVSAGPSLGSLRNAAHGTAALALAMLSDQAGHWHEARRHLIDAVRLRPSLLTSFAIARRLARLSLAL